MLLLSFVIATDTIVDCCSTQIVDSIPEGPRKLLKEHCLQQHALRKREEIELQEVVVRPSSQSSDSGDRPGITCYAVEGPGKGADGVKIVIQPNGDQLFFGFPEEFTKYLSDLKILQEKDENEVASTNLRNRRAETCKFLTYCGISVTICTIVGIIVSLIFYAKSSNSQFQYCGITNNNPDCPYQNCGKIDCMNFYTGQAPDYVATNPNCNWINGIQPNRTPGICNQEYKNFISQQRLRKDVIIGSVSSFGISLLATISCWSHIRPIRQQ